MAYEAWKVVHVFGVVLLFASLGALAGVRAASPAGTGLGRSLKILHGVALAIVFLAGFGLLAKLGMGSPATWGGWVWIKLAIWLLLGAALALVKRAERWAPLAVVAFALAGAVAAWAAVFKPGA